MVETKCIKRPPFGIIKIVLNSYCQLIRTVTPNKEEASWQKNYSNTSKNSQNGFYSSKEENQSKNRNSTSNSGSNKNSSKNSYSNKNKNQHKLQFPKCR